CVIPGRQFFEYVHHLPGENPIELKQTGKTVLVRTRGFRATFRIAEAEDFPLLPAVGNETGVSIDARLLCQGVGDVVFAAAREEARPEIHSVYMAAEAGELRLAATDSFRLAERVVPVGGMSGKFSLLLPLPTAQEVVRLFATQASVQFVPQETLIMFRGEGVELSSRLLDATYPDYQQIIPQSSQTRVAVDREKLTRALKTLVVFLPRDSRRLKLHVRPDQGQLNLGVVGGEAGEGEVTLEAEIQGEAQELLLNVQYLLEGAQHVTSEKVEMACSGPEAPVVFRLLGGSGYVYVVMPIQA
ncbi:MAG: DNA polymerase III subunit beta, partial [Patescibacteria group bacterium]